MTPTDPRLDHSVLPVLIWTSGPDGAFDYLNPRWTEFTGRPVSQMLGWKWLDGVHPEDRERVIVEYSEAVSARAPTRLEFRMLHRDGGYRWFLGTGEPCYGSDRGFLGYSGCITDVTERRALEERLAQLGRSEEIAQLAGGIAHDFNNLLTGIMGHVALLQMESSPSAEALDDLNQIRLATERAATLSRHLLAFSRRSQLAPRSLDLSQLVSGTVSAIRQVVGPAVEVSHHLGDGLEPVLADPVQLEQILLQLGAQARDAMPAGGKLRLRTERVEVDDAVAAQRPGLRAGGYITLEVRRTAPAVSPEAARQGGEPADLSTIAGIARRSGGYVEVHSEQDGDTSVTLYIPRLQPSPDIPDEPEPAPHRGGGTILLVEDDHQVREVGRRALERAGYTVLAASDAETAIAAADRHPGEIQLLVTDVVLPKVNGRELAARLAIHRPAIKVLYVSGTTDGVIARHRMLEPGIEFLEKPFALDSLLRKVRRILGADLSSEDPAAWAPRSLV
ncbi:MAG TPA: response regulator [Gemmatimonadales bacterium]|jgi:PAS domain S-box-containing protein